MKRRDLITIAGSVVLGYFVMGFCDIVGIASDYVQSTFHWSATMTGFVPSLVFVWFLFLAVPTGYLMSRIGSKKVVALSMVVTLAGMLLPFVAFNSVTCLLAFVFLGIGNTILQVSLNPLVNSVVTRKSLVASCLTGGQVVKALSSLLGPEIIMLACLWSGAENWYYSFFIMGAVTLLALASVMMMPRIDDAETTHVSIMECVRMLSRRRMLILFMGIFAIVGIDVAINFISSKWMMGIFNWSQTEAKYAPQVYFLCRTVGAFVGMVVLTKTSETLYFRISMLVGLAAVAVMTFAGNAYVALAMIGLAGFAFSSIFSIIYSIAFKLFPDNTHAVSGLMITAISGGALIPPILGFSVDSLGMRGATIVILVCIAYLIYCSFADMQTPATDNNNQQ